MKFAIIGLDAPNTFSTNMTKALKKLGHSTYFLSLAEIRSRYLPTAFKAKFHLTQKHPIDLREVLPMDNYDMVIISHNALVFNNPKIGSTKVLFYMREMLDYPSCMNPDILAYNVPNQDRYIRQYYPPLYFSTENRINLPIAVDPEEWDPNREKDLKGLNFVSCYENIMEEKRDYTWNQFYDTYLDRVEKYSPICTVNGGQYVDFAEYKDYMERSEAFLNVMTPSVYYSRRLLEAAASKTFPVIHVENDESIQYHEELGFGHDVNCWMFKDELSIPTFEGSELYENALELNLELILNNHTYEHRAQQILELF